ncbi:hypothetical protein [Kaarinaea lacus]
MKQMNDTYNELDTRSTEKRLLPLVAFGFAILLSSAAMGAEPVNKDNDSIVMAMYGFLDTKYADTTSYTDDDYVNDLVQSVYGKHTGPDYSDESIYVDSLIKSVEGSHRPVSPNFSNDDVYVNHLVEVIMN